MNKKFILYLSFFSCIFLINGCDGTSKTSTSDSSDSPPPDVKEEKSVADTKLNEAHTTTDTIDFEANCITKNRQKYCIGDNINKYGYKGYLVDFNKEIGQQNGITFLGPHVDVGDNDFDVKMHKIAWIMIDKPFLGKSEHGIGIGSPESDVVKALSQRADYRKNTVTPTENSHCILNENCYITTNGVVSDIDIHPKQIAKSSEKFNANADEESNVQAIAIRWKNSWESRNLSKAELIMHNDFSGEGLNKWQWLQQRKVEAIKTKSRKINWDDIHVSINGDIASLNATQSYHDEFNNGKTYDSKQTIVLNFIRWTDGNWYIKGLSEFVGDD